jgi:hypothetical protein
LLQFVLVLMVGMVQETLATETCFFVEERKVSFEKTVTYETVSTTDDSSRHDEDGLSASSQECNEFLTTTSDDGAFLSDFEDDMSDSNISGFRTPDPLDFMPVAQVPTAFSEQEIADTMARLENVAQQQVFPGAGALRGMPPMAMPAMPAMQPMGAGPSYPAGTVIKMVPVPVSLPVPKMLAMPMPFPMAAPAPSHVPVPPGFKLVKIPERARSESPEAAEAKPAEKSYSEIADPSKTERKIFVGGLSPETTEESLAEYFSQFGAVSDAKVIRDGEKSKGFAFVQFVDPTPPKGLDAVHFIDQRRCGVGLALQRQR